MGSEFDEQIAVTSAGDGRYDADLSAGWLVGGGVNGGYLLSVVGNAIRSELPAKPDPLALSAYFLSPGTPGPATVDVDVRREGGTVATVAAELRQGDDTRITALATYGDLDRRAGDVRTTASEIDLPPRDQCVSNRHAPEDVEEVRGADGALRDALPPRPDRLGGGGAERARRS